MSRKKHDRIIHFEAAIQRMRFVSLHDAYRFLADVSGHVEDNGGYISIEEMMSLYRPSLSGVEVAYDYDNAEDWGLSSEKLQHVGIYKAPKSTKLTQTSDKWQMNVEFWKGDGYYLVVRGVEKMEDITNE